jgi:hypothetical protein
MYDEPGWEENVDPMAQFAAPSTEARKESEAKQFEGAVLLLCSNNADTQSAAFGNAIKQLSGNDFVKKAMQLNIPLPDLRKVGEVLKMRREEMAETARQSSFDMDEEYLNVADDEYLDDVEGLQEDEFISPYFDVSNGAAEYDEPEYDSYDNDGWSEEEAEPAGAGMDEYIDLKELDLGTDTESEGSESESDSDDGAALRKESAAFNQYMDVKPDESEDDCEEQQTSEDEEDVGPYSAFAKAMTPSDAPALKTTLISRPKPASATAFSAAEAAFNDNESSASGFSSDAFTATEDEDEDIDDFNPYAGFAAPEAPSAAAASAPQGKSKAQDDEGFAANNFSGGFTLGGLERSTVETSFLSTLARESSVKGNRH